MNYLEDGAYHNIELYEIKDGETIYNGKLYKARDRINDLSHETDWDFIPIGEG